MSFDILETTVSADVAASGTATLNYPDGRNSGSYRGAVDHVAVWGKNQVLNAPADFTLTFGASNITFTLGSGQTTIPAGTRLVVQAEHVGANEDDVGIELADSGKMDIGHLVHINLGAPDTLDADGIAAAQAVAAPGNLTINGALASGGAVEFDVPRGVQIVSSNAGDTTQTATFTGTDEYGETVVEEVAFNGTTPVLGTKAFKTVTQVAISAALTGNGSAGSTDVLGLPVYLPEIGFVLKELEDGAAPTAGTIVSGVRSVATATTGDVRGTYDPNTAADGSNQFALVAFIPNPADKGVDQFAG